MDEVIKVEEVDLACVKPLEALPHPLQERSELFLVIAADQLLFRPAPLLRVLDVCDPDLVAHPRQPTRWKIRSEAFPTDARETSPHEACPEGCPELRNSDLR
jgi:hypothetical protein